LIFKAKEIASRIEAPNLFIALRSQLSGEKSGYGILEYFLVFGLFASLYRLFTFNDFSDLGTRAKLKFILSILISFTFLVLSTARTSIFLYFIAFFFIIYLKGKLRSKYILRFVIVSFVAFIIVGIVLNKGGSLAYSLSENIRSGLNHLLAYFEGPVLAFDRFLNSDFTHSYGQNTFRFFFALLYELGITETKPLDIIREWIYVPYPTNVYTVFYPYIMDFGVVVCGVIIFLFGLVHTWLFYRSKSSGNHFKMKTAFSYYPLLMVFFQDQYFTLLSQWIQLWFYSLIILYILGNYLFRKDHVG
jgi:oligosaccharide repeat unit polymerase